MKRDANGRMMAGGGSLNPGGRPKVVGEVVELARLHTVEALDTIAELMRESDSPATRLAAAESLLAKGWGKALAAPKTHDERDNSLVGKDVAQLLEVMRAGKSGDPSAEH